MLVKLKSDALINWSGSRRNELTAYQGLEELLEAAERYRQKHRLPEPIIYLENT
jgi:hypothetical protein